MVVALSRVLLFSFMAMADAMAATMHCHATRPARRAAAHCKMTEAFPVIKRFCGGSWTNSYRVFDGLAFERQEDRERTVTWEVAGNQCTATLQAGEQEVVLRGEHIGDGVVKFDAQGLPFEYKFHQVDEDTLLVSRTESGVDAPASRLDVGSIVLVSDHECVQTIVHLEGSELGMLEVIKGSRGA